MMEKVTLYVKKILSLGLSFLLFVLLTSLLKDLQNDRISLFTGGTLENYRFLYFLIFSFSLLVFAYLNFRITGEKPRFLFGMNQSDNFLNEKGGFWNLFKWIVTLFGLLYDLVVWTLWGAFLIFILFSEILLLVKEILYWIIHAIIWFFRQLFPPLIFMFQMLLHYVVNWIWWIYKVAVNNLKISMHKNFYFIALWGTIPALFIVFLFFAISQVVGIPELTAISAVFALIPIVWSFGEIAALRHEKRVHDKYNSVQTSFRNGFEAVRSVLVYLIIIVVLLVSEVLLNFLGWIPNLSMSILGITLNLNMAISLLLVFMAILIAFAGCILPTHVLYHPDYDTDFRGSLGYLSTIGRKFLRYLFSTVPIIFFGSLLMVIPFILLFSVYQISEPVKDKVLDIRIEQLNQKRVNMDALEDYRSGIRMNRLELYQEMPLLATENFRKLARASGEIDEIEDQIIRSKDELSKRKDQFNAEYGGLTAAIDDAGSGGGGASVTETISRLSEERNQLDEAYKIRVESLNESITYLKEDLKELKRKRIQMPVLYFFIGILFSVFGGFVISVFIMYMGNVYYELYGLREDGKPSYWVSKLNEIRHKDANQPLLGFTFLVIIAILSVLMFTQGIFV